MEHKAVHDETAEPEITYQPTVDQSYSIISYKASKLPAAYLPVIFSKWLRTYRIGNPIFKKMDPAEYYERYHIFIENLLAKPDSLVRLAVLSDDHDIVLGFSVSREDVLDYVHVHKDYKRAGMAKLLVPKGITTFSHITEVALNIWQDKYKHLVFNPFA